MKCADTVLCLPSLPVCSCPYKAAGVGSRQVQPPRSSYGFTETRCVQMSYAHTTGHKPDSPSSTFLEPDVAFVHTVPSSSGLLCDLLWSDPDKDVQGWGENDRGVSFTFGADVVSKFLNRHDLDLICRAHQVGIPSPLLEPLQIKASLCQLTFVDLAPSGGGRRL